MDQHHAYYPGDTGFAARARLLQSLWREKHGWPMEGAEDEKHRQSEGAKPKRLYGNKLDPGFARKSGVNFLTPRIRELVRGKISEIRENGGMISEPRIWNNLLSSQPLCFNMFGEMTDDPDLTTRFLEKVLPGTVTRVTRIDFEYSTRRGQPDRSAFDVYIEYLSGRNKCFFGIEVKYAESLREETAGIADSIFSNHEESYEKLASDSGYFRPGVQNLVRQVPFAQIFRDHLLAHNMSTTDLPGSFIYLYPYSNAECHAAVTGYSTFLSSQDSEVSHFRTLDLEACIRALQSIHNVQWTRDLRERYLGEKV